MHIYVWLPVLHCFTGAWLGLGLGDASMSSYQRCRSVRTARTARSRGQEGQGMLEYILIMLFVVLVVFGGLLMLGPHLANIFGTIHNTL